MIRLRFILCRRKLEIHKIPSIFPKFLSISSTLRTSLSILSELITWLIAQAQKQKHTALLFLPFLSVYGIFFFVHSINFISLLNIWNKCENISHWSCILNNEDKMESKHFTTRKTFTTRNTTTSKTRIKPASMSFRKIRIPFKFHRNINDNKWK